MSTPIDEFAPVRLHESFQRIYADHVELVLRYLCVFVGNPADAEDLCADTFVRAWRAWPRFVGNDASARAWLLRIAANVARSRHRRVRATVPLHPDQADPANHSATSVERIILKAAMGRLRRGDRAVLGLRASGLSFSEIGAVQGRSEDAAKMACHRAMTRLRQELHTPND
ncbi:MAG: RNA polymerase sigma factor [Candidatus Dormibacteria bacterium]